MNPVFNSEKKSWDALLKLTRSWKLESNVDGFLSQMVLGAVQGLGYERGGILLLDEGGFRLQSERSASKTPREEINKSLADKISKKVVLQAKVISGVYSSKNTTGKHEKLNVLCAPLLSKGGVLGTLYLETSNLKAGVDHEGQQVAELFCLHGATALENSILYRSAITDSMTGLFSHVYFQQEAEQSIRNARRSGRSLSMIILDLDYFKKINDVFGHEVGNKIIINTSEVLNKSLRNSDLLARFGGDEFEILLTDTPLTSATQVVEKIMVNIGQLKLPDGSALSATMGLASFPENVLNAQDLFLEADAALYEAKEAGRNTYRVSKNKITKKVKSQLSAMVEKNRKGVDRKRDFLGSIDGYKVLKKLEKGHGGETFLVDQSELKRTVSLRRLKNGAEDVFEKEAKLTASLDHPGIISIYTMGMDLDGLRYYTMKPLSGMTLSKVFKKLAEGDREVSLSYSKSKLIEILHRVSETIAFAHKRGVTHFNLNPENIVLGKFGQITVIDWTFSSAMKLSDNKSFALRIDREIQKTKSLNYLAPELLGSKSNQEGEHSDVYSLGVMLYEILTRETPFERAEFDPIKSKQPKELSTPESLRPYEGIDPFLSKLCMQCLHEKVGTRPKSSELSSYLERYSHRGKNKQAFDLKAQLRNKDWKKIRGGWSLKGDEWVSEGERDHVLIWNQPVRGDFKFICEGWMEKDGELSLICKGPKVGEVKNRKDWFSGYCFQFGAEGNACSKLARGAHDTMVDTDTRLTPGRRYRLSLSYESGWLSCYVDEKRIFHYRELFPLAGNSIGFYAYGPGAHFKPILVEKENAGLTVETIRMADDLYQNKFYEKALAQYEQLADAYFHRMEGLEATLKCGMCLAQLNKDSEARVFFKKLEKSTLEPFALAEEATMLLQQGKEKYYKRGLSLFEKLFDKFPKSQATISIYEVVKTLNQFKAYNRQINLKKEILIKLLTMGRDEFSSPLLSGLRCHIALVEQLMLQGQWQKAYREGEAFSKNLSVTYSSMQLQQQGVALAKFGEAHPTLLINHENVDYYPAVGSFSPCIILFSRSQVNQLRRVLNVGVQERLASGVGLFRDTLLLSWLNYLQKKEKEGREVVLDHFTSSSGARSSHIFMEKVHSFGDEILYSKIKELRSVLNPNEGGDFTLKYFCGLWLLEKGDLKGASEELIGLKVLGVKLEQTFNDTDLMNICDDLFLAQILLESLGYGDSSKIIKYKKDYSFYLSGVYKDMAEIFLGIKKPKPGKLWPSAIYQPKHYLWLGLWLEAKGKKKQAEKISKSALDDRLGFAFYQRPLKSLILRVTR